jgi:hypothetical protein
VGVDGGGCRMERVRPMGLLGDSEIGFNSTAEHRH